MHCPTIDEFPSPPPDTVGWPWTQETRNSKETISHGSIGPRISIVIPSYDQGKFIEEAIRSVFWQGYPNLELIIIDGGSKDGSVDVIRKYSPWLSYWVSEKDRGQSHAINKGFEHVTGDIITFLSADDMYIPGALQDISTRWQEWKDYGAIVGGFYYMDEQSRLDTELHLPILLREAPLDLTLGPPGNYRLHQVSTFYSRKALDNVGRWVKEDLSYTMDRELLYRVCRKYKLYLTDKPYGAFRQHDQSKSVSSILPFSQEFAKLYLLNVSGSKSEDRLRHKMARYQRARGYIKYAKATNNVAAAGTALLIAAYYLPNYLSLRSYLSTWLDLLRLKSIFKSILGYHTP